MSLLPVLAHGLEWTRRKPHHAAMPTDLATATRRNVTGCDGRHGHIDLRSLTRGALRSGPDPKTAAGPALPPSLPGAKDRSEPNVLVLAVRIISDPS